MEREIKNVITGYGMIPKGSRVLAGVSGGADSRCLFEVLCALREELGFSLCVVHVDHGIRETSARDADAVRALCESRKIPVRVERIEDISAEQAGMSLEEAARRLRYRIFAEALDFFGADRLALAHNMDDQAETVLFKLFRGAGLAGMAGIRAVTVMDEPRLTIVRPLLFTPRSEIEKYLAEKGIDDICEDETTRTDEYARNRIRHNILPYANGHINSSASAHLAAAAGRAGEALDFIEQETKKRFRRLSGIEDGQTSGGGSTVSLSVDGLMTEPVFMQKQILMEALKRAGTPDISETHVRAFLRLAQSAEGTESFDLPGGMRVIRRYDRLYIERDAEAAAGSEVITVLLDEPGSFEIDLKGTGTMAVRIFDADEGVKEIPADPYTKWFDRDKIGRSVCFRKRRPGDRIDVGGLKKRLTREMIDLKIPADKRDDMWVMAEDDMVLLIPGYRRCEGLFVDEATRHILEVRSLKDRL